VKRCINPLIRAHLLQGAFYLILLVAVCVIPFALGQRATTKQSAVAAPRFLGSGPLATLSTGDDPASGTWTLTGSLNTARYLHTATLLPNGMVLVAGGLDSNLNALPSAELYDPASGTWTATGNLNTACALHTATLLSNGMVLVAGGHDGPTFAPSDILSSTELYDPTSGTWTFTGNLNTARQSHTATLLPNGMALVAGGFECCSPTSASAELYYPTIGTWTFTGNLNTARAFHTATLLPNGMVLVAGGETGGGLNASSPVNPDGAPSWSLGVSDAIFPVASAELYTPGPTPTPTPTPRATPRPRPTPHPRPTPPFTPTPTATPVATPTPTPTGTSTPTPTATPQSLAAWERPFEQRHK
jgi:hypothetical protein